MDPIANTAWKKTETLICLFYEAFFSLEVSFYLYKSTRWPCLEYCCHVWTGAPTSYLHIIDKVQKQTCRTVGFLLAVSLESSKSSKCNQVNSFMDITMVDVHLNWLNWFHFHIFVTGPLVILIGCVIFW